MSWQNKVAIVTGASAGLGFHLSKQLADQGARVVMAARDAERLERALDRIVAESSRVSRDQLLAVASDVTRPDDVERLFGQVELQFGQLDLLVNCAGRSMRGWASQTDPAIFQELLELNFLATVRCCQQAIPVLQQSGHGTIINIGSLAARVATPVLGAYPASKFALAAYSEQLRRELRSAGIHVLIAFPGPIARDETQPRYSDQTAGLDKIAERPGGSRLRPVAPELLAARILAAAARGQAELMPLKARLFCMLSLGCPTLGDWILRRISS